ncbi:MAG: histidinol dehydrogenase, partial [Paracoccaceae bacterium]
MPVTLSHDQPDFEACFAALLEATRAADADVDAAVAEIIADVRARGAAALIELTRRFDGLELTEATLAFAPAEIDAAIAAVPAAERAALELAAA